MRILLVDDDKTILFTIGSFMRQLGHEVREAISANEALTYIAKEDFALVLSDIRMPGMSGIDLLNKIQGMPLLKPPRVVLFTGYGNMESAIGALRAGAYDYLLKPVKVEEVTNIVQKVAEYHEAENSLGQCGDILSVEDEHEKSAYIYSEAIARVVIYAKKYHTDRTMLVLIQGETGTGKEIIARIIHNDGKITNQPFVDVNCGAIPDSLFESELFGYEAGAFTGGDPKGKKGMIEAAAGGTLFLDEIGDMPANLQVKLLRVLQEREFYRVGGIKKIKADIRIICATNADLLSKVKEGLFRKDLYYRLKGGVIRLPPLREYREAIIPLAIHFLRNAAQQKGKMFRGISQAAAAVLLTYDWPGNIRELKTIIEWSVFMHNDILLQPEHLSNLINESINTEEYSSFANKIYLNRENIMLPADEFPLDEFINQIIVKAIDMHDGNKAAAARYLKMSRRALYGRFKEIT